MDDQEKKLVDFCSITGTSVENAKLYLQATEWDIQLALLNFCEVSNSVIGGEIRTRYHNINNRVPPQPQQHSLQGENDESGNMIRHERNSYNLIEDTSSADNTTGNEEAFFAGGSVSSGQQILGPAANNNANAIIDMFRAVCRSVIEDPQSALSDGSFLGAGHRLGQPGEESEVISNDSERINVNESTEMVLRVWRDGFTLDDGPLRSLDNHEDRQFLQRIASGEVPPELTPQNSGSVKLKIEDHTFEKFKRSTRPIPFTGQGQALGSTMDPPESTEQNTDSEEKPNIPVDNNRPVTTIQVRLADEGRMLRVKLNHNHTIGDLRNYITTLGPHYSSGNFRIVTSFPNKELGDNNATVEQAGILNSAILIRLK